MATHICMFVNNPGLNDPRVTREAEVAVQAGFRVTVLAVQGPNEDGPLCQVQRGVTFLRPKVKPSKIVAWLRRFSNKKVPAFAEAPNDVRSSQDFTAARTSLGFFKRLCICLWKWRHSFLYAVQAVPLAIATKADVYHAHDCDTLAISWLCARLRSRPLVYDSHELWFDVLKMRGTSRLVLAKWRFIETTLAKKCVLCITVSEGLKNILIQRYMLRSIVVVKNCPRITAGDKEPDRRAARESCGLDPRARIVVYQGGILTYRGLETLITASSRLPDVEFVIIGPVNEYARKLMELAKRFSTANVMFLGHKEKEERDTFMVAGDIGASLIQDGSLSYRYNLANKVFEYLSNGLPVLLSKLPEYERLASKTGACIMADPEDSDDVSEKIRAFFAMSPKARDAMGLRARQAFQEEYNMEKQMEPVLAFYAGCNTRNRD